MPRTAYEHPLKPELRLYGGVLSALLALCWACALYGGPGWWFEVGGNFAVPVAICAALLALALAWARGWAWLGVAAATGLWSASVPLTWSTGSLPGPPPPAAAPGQPASLRLLVANIWSSNPRQDEVVAQVRAAEADVAVLLETTPAWEAAVSELAADLPYVVAQPRTDNFGMTLLSRHPLNGARVLDVGGLDGGEIPLIRAEVRTPLGPLTVLGVHVFPPVSAEAWELREVQLLRVAELARETAGPVVVAGDLNTSMSTRSYRLFRTASGLANARKGRGWQGSWPAWAPAELQLPLDHVLHDEEIVIHELEVLPGAGSDHRGLVVELSLGG